MKTILGLTLCALLVLVGCSQKSPSDATADAAQIDNTVQVALASGEEQTVEVGCAACMYKMTGIQACQTAAKIDGVAFIVDGGSVDAHSAGLCHATKQAVVAGKIENNRLVATKVELQ